MAFFASKNIVVSISSYAWTFCKLLLSSLLCKLLPHIFGLQIPHSINLAIAATGEPSPDFGTGLPPKHWQVLWQWQQPC